MITEQQSIEERRSRGAAGDDADLLRSHEAEEPNLADMFLPLVVRRRLILKWAAVCGVIAAITVFLLPNQYTATTEIMPPQQAQSTAGTMLGQLGMLAGLAGKDLGIKNPADMYVGIIKSRSVADGIIEKFGLQSYYRDKYLSDTRRRLEKQAAIEAGKDGLITIKFKDKNPQRAADIANAYVDQLYLANQRLAISEASQRRLFYEKQLEAEKNHLADAEVDLKRTEEKTGLIQLGSQADAIIRSVAQLQAQLAAKEIQLQSLRSFATAENPEFILLQQEIVGLKAQLAKLEQTNTIGGGNIAVPTGKIPEVGLLYVRKLREVKYQEELFEVLAKQFEAAKIDEGKNAPIIQVVDRAIAPDKRSGPLRLLIISGSLLLGIILGCMHAWISGAFQKMKRDPEQQTRIDAYRKALG